MKSTNLITAMRTLLVGVGMMIASSLFAQTSVTGTVKDAAGNGIIGASAFVQGTHNGTVVDMNGSFTLSNAKVGDKIEFSCIGYTSKVLTWNGAPLNVVLDEDAELLEGTVVTALGIRKDEKKVGYAVSSVDASKLVATASPSLGSALYGKASGVRISTAPGGATGAININVRGLSSITGTSQPLVIVDGVPIRNGEANLGDYWAVQRMQSNGLTDINVEDIENLTILKGASATSLYGSEGANGVVLITMKQGKKNSGVHVDFNASVQADVVAYMPKYQTTFGPGYPYPWWGYGGLVDDPSSEYFGFDIRRMGGTDKNGKTIDVPSVFNAYYYFGPKYDGREVYTPTGYRKFLPITDDPWSDLFRTGILQQYNLAITTGNEHGNTRFSYTFMDNVPNQYNSHLGKHNFQVSGSQDIAKGLKLGYSVNYMNQHVKNRPYRIARLVANYSGMFGPFDDVVYYREHVMTSAGFYNRAWTDANHENPSEGWYFGNNLGGFLDEYAWNIIGREQYENNQRLIASVTPSWEIVKGLTLKSNIATDWTVQDIELKERAKTSPAITGKPDGHYSITKRDYQTLYGDVMLNWDTKITQDLGLTAIVGYSIRNEKYLQTNASARNGLTDLNHFHLNFSNEDARSSESTSDMLKQAVFATASLSWRDWAYLEGTIRNETTSTLNGQSFWYPSVNASIIYSELFNLPAWVDYGKFRVSYGVVGLAPELYKAPISYTQKTASSKYVYQQLGDELGNDSIRPEMTHEWEFGIENKFFHNRLGFDLSYYHKRIVDQILQATTPRSAGGKNMLVNVGELENQGVELALYGTPIESADWRLDLSGNIAWNTNKVVKLMDGLDRLQHQRWDNGAAYLYSIPGQKMGDIYAFAPMEDANGNKVVDAEGLYKVSSEPVKVGNAIPDLIGGFAASLSYKRWTLDANFNFQIGGDVWNQPYQYMMGLGALADSMPFRDEEHGGLAYYVDADGNNVAAAGLSKGPNGEYIHHDGQILEGVTEDGKPNTTIVSTDYLLEESYSWGVGGPIYYSHSIFRNSYLKCRELSLSYTLPENFTRKFKCNALRLSVFARNPFFIYKNLPIFDAEAMDSTRWTDAVQIGGSTSSSRTFGFTLRANF